MTKQKRTKLEKIEFLMKTGHNWQQIVRDLKATSSNSLKQMYATLRKEKLHSEYISNE